MAYQNEDSVLLTNSSAPTGNNDVSGGGHPSSSSFSSAIRRHLTWKKNISTIGLTVTLFGCIASYLYYSGNTNQTSMLIRGSNEDEGNVYHDVVDEMKLWEDTTEISMMKISSDDLFSAKRERHECHKDRHYSKNTLKAAFELPFVALFKDNKGEKKFEASSITKV